MSLLCCLRSLVTSTWFLVFTILGILLIEFAMLKTKRVRAVDEARDSKYPSFRRTDVKLWKRWRLYLFAPILLPKILICFATLALLLISAKLVFISAGKNKNLALVGWRKAIVKNMARFTARSCLFIGAGMYWYKLVRPVVDWKKYLGPEWKASYENPSSIISNHQTWVDIAMHTIIKFPSFTPKASIKKWPLIGDICIYVFNSLFINRSATPEERAQIMEDIKQRQLLSETGKVQPILIFPEGCTTNHTSIVTFRRGAFFAERSVQPFTIEYSSPYFNVAHDILNFVAHILLIACQPSTTCRVKMLPVFQPNEWFFSKH